jgi:hypothetical protein
VYGGIATRFALAVAGSAMRTTIEPDYRASPPGGAE